MVVPNLGPSIEVRGEMEPHVPLRVHRGVVPGPSLLLFPHHGDKACMQTDIVLGVFVTFSRTVADLFFLFHMVLKFRTAYISPTSRVYGRKELVTDPRDIASRYLKSDFIIDLLATLPPPRVITPFPLFIVHSAI
ncbi:unnamed protein product [Sphenostylis stenocarpa]|uniref:Uncharacterized protein n=1 Tax=Sphenostylis stenocarpa TaxID=92480 RepID=A0AA86T634_9FABA|nr:unnamed protein product [Sphenostylis stenocarpa]